MISIQASQLVVGCRITFFCVRTYEDGTAMVITCPMEVSDIVYLLNSTRKEGWSREKYFVDEDDAHLYAKEWEAKWEASQ